MHKIDLHTHSTGSRDGGLREKHYRTMLEEGRLDFVAVTDHNTVDNALKLNKIFGHHVIVGEEIMTLQGEIIGLFLTKTIPAGLSVEQAIIAIREQDGLVYVPHPFEKIRKGLSMPVLDSIKADIDIIEVHNGRALSKKYGRLAGEWAYRNNKATAVSSDAHGKGGWGRTYSRIASQPTKESLVELLLQAEHKTGFPGLRGILYPKVNRIRRRKGMKKRA